MVTRTGVVRRKGAKKTAGRDKGKPRTVGPRGQGRPVFTPTEEQKTLVTVMIAGGIQHQHIANALGISKPTLEKHFRYEIDNGAAQANAKVIANLFRQTNDNVRAAEFWLTNRMKGQWAHRHEVDGNLKADATLTELVLGSMALKKKGGSGGGNEGGGKRA